MNEINEINVICEPQGPQEKNTQICISVREEAEEGLKYKFLIGVDGTWHTIQDFSCEKQILWTPIKDGNYIIMVQVRKKDSKKSFDYLCKIDYTIGNDTNKFITNLFMDNRDLSVGDKASVRVESPKISLVYRYWIKRDQKWEMLKDYSADNRLTFTVKEQGKQELLVECKEVNSTNKFDDFKEIKFNVRGIKKLEIIDFKSLSHDFLVDEEITFQVDVEHEDNRMVLYKFIKLDADGFSTCIQDFSSKRLVSYKEDKQGNYKLLCLVKDMYSPKSFDDRALIHYSVRPYKPIIIESFTTDLTSPQICGSDIKLKTVAKGGKNLLYRYFIKGEQCEDSGYIRSNSYIWKTHKPGEYDIQVWVKDKSSEEQCEAFNQMKFNIDELYLEDVNIDGVLLDKDNKILKNETVNLQVSASGGVELKYSFIIYKDNKIIRQIDYQEQNFMNFTPSEIGQYSLEVRVKDKYSRKEYDCHNVVNLEVFNCIPASIDHVLTYPKENYIVGESIKFEIILSNGKEVLTKYNLKINGRDVEESEYTEDMKYEFIPKCSGLYTIKLYAKNRKSEKTYDDIRDFKVNVQDALHITNTKLRCDKINILCNEDITLTAACHGGKDILYEFYLMENGEWSLVQEYSKKEYYTFIPFRNDSYKVLVLAKSLYKKESYEDYAVFEFKAEAQ